MKNFATYEKAVATQAGLQKATAELLALEQKKAALFREMMGAIAQQILNRVLEIVQEARPTPERKLFWIRQFDPQNHGRTFMRSPHLKFHKVGEPVAFPIITRNRFDNKDMQFIVCGDGDVLVGAGYRLPPDRKDLVLLLTNPNTNSEHIFQSLLRQVRLEEPGAQDDEELQPRHNAYGMGGSYKPLKTRHEADIDEVSKRFMDRVRREAPMPATPETLAEYNKRVETPPTYEEQVEFCKRAGIAPPPAPVGADVREQELDRIAKEIMRGK